MLTIRDIRKRFDGIEALKGVGLEMLPGEIHGIVGENGAGKSTLMKILTGAIQKDSGEILLNGKPVKIDSPHDSQRLGISIIYQERNLIPEMTVAENIFLGNLPYKFGTIVDRETLNNKAEELTKSLGLPIDPGVKSGELNVAHQQVVEIAKALSFNAKLIIFDEPTTPLTEKEIFKLFEIIKSLKNKGVTIIYISHILKDILSICDRVSVMKDGELLDTLLINSLNEDILISLMLGRKLEEKFPSRNKRIGTKIFIASDIESGKENFYLKKGEILGIFGLVGAGRTELALDIFGYKKLNCNKYHYKGKDYLPQSPYKAIKNGIGLVTEDRKSLGIFHELSVLENITMSLIVRNSNLGLLNTKKYLEMATTLIKNLKIKISSLKQPAYNLSGGNQQKVMISRWLSADSNLLIFDEPTKGVDVGAKTEIYKLMNSFVEFGNCILMISSEMEEIVGMSDRAYVMRNGKICKELNDDEITNSNLLRYAMLG